MANVKISALPPVSSVTGTDVLPVVATTTTSKLTITNLANSLPQVTSSISASYALSGSFTVSASYALSSSFAVSSSLASLARTASYVENARTASYVENARTASYVENAQTASYVLNAVSASLAANALTASFVANAQTASYVLNAVSASYSQNADLLDGKNSTIFATTGSNNFDGNQIVTGSLTVNDLSVKSNLATGGGFTVESGLVASYVAMGKYGQIAQLYMETAGDTGLNNYPNFTFYSQTDGISFRTPALKNFQITSSVGITGNLNVDGGITGSLLGTASFATTASYVLNAVSASLAANALTASYVENAQTASFVANAQTASYVLNAVTASYVQNAQTASYVLNAVSASFASTLAPEADITVGDLSVVGVANITLGALRIPVDLPATPDTGSMYVQPIANKLWIYTGNAGVAGWVTASLG